MDIPKYFNLVGQVSHMNALDRQKSASFLLFLNWVGIIDKGVILGKIYEYIASGVPIILIGHTSQIEISKIIKESGYFIYVNSQADLDNLIHSYIQGSLKLPKRNIDFISQFQYSGQSKTLISILNNLVTEQVSVDLDGLEISVD